MLITKTSKLKKDRGALVARAEGHSRYGTIWTVNKNGDPVRCDFTSIEMQGSWIKMVEDMSWNEVLASLTTCVPIHENDKVLIDGKKYRGRDLLEVGV